MGDLEINPKELSEEIKELLPYLRKIKDFEFRLNYNIAKTVNFTWGILFLFAGVLDYMLTINKVRPDFGWVGVVIIGFFLQSMIERQNLLYESTTAEHRSIPWVDIIIIGLNFVIVVFLIQLGYDEFVSSTIWITNGILAVWKKENDLYEGWGCITDNFQRNIIGVGSFSAAGINLLIIFFVNSFLDVAGLVSGIIVFLAFLAVYMFNRNKESNVSIDN